MWVGERGREGRISAGAAAQTLCHRSLHAGGKKLAIKVTKFDSRQRLRFYESLIPDFVIQNGNGDIDAGKQRKQFRPLFG
jgi:hypothetical protein